MKQVTLLDKTFEVSIPEATIQDAIQKMATAMNRDLKGKDVFFIGILNGSFMFAADLLKHVDIKCQITFLKLASYQGTSSTGTVKRLIGINEDLEDKTVIILEDIIDTGNTLDSIIKQLKGYDPAEIKIASMLFKPEAYTKNIKVDYVGLEIPNDFIVGYGLDYDGYGRNLRDIYTLVS